MLRSRDDNMASENIAKIEQEGQNSNDATKQNKVKVDFKENKTENIFGN